MLETWYKHAVEQLESDIKTNKKLNGMDFLQDFFLENRDEHFPDTNFDEFDLLVSSAFTPFEDWLKKNDYSWLKILSNGKWYLTKPGAKRIATQAKDRDETKLESSDISLLEKPSYTLEKEDLVVYLELFSRLQATKLYEDIYICAKRIAQCGELDFNLTLVKKAEYWKKAAKHSTKIPSVASSSDYKKAAKLYQKDYSHLEAAKCYEDAYNISFDKESKEAIELLRFSRIQFEMFGAHEEAMRVYVLEKDKEKGVATGLKKFSLNLYKWTSEYGEKPWKVVFAAIIILSISTLSSCSLGITNGDTLASGSPVLIHEFWNSLYYSIITFTTLGYGDFSPIGFLGKVLACLVSISGLLLTSLFMITVVRKYSRG